MVQAKQGKTVRTRRSYSQEFKQEAVQMLLDGHSCDSPPNSLGTAAREI